MGGAATALVNALIVRWREGCFVAQATEVDAVRAASANGAVVLDLGRFLGTAALSSAEPDSPWGQCRDLLVRTGQQRVCLRVRASLLTRRLPAESFYLLPGLMRDAGAPPWLRGVVLLYGGAPEPGDTAEIGIWVDMPELAGAIYSENEARSASAEGLT